MLTLIEVEGSVEMRLKHMNPDMTGWEEKTTSDRSRSSGPVLTPGNDFSP